VAAKRRSKPKPHRAKASGTVPAEVAAPRAEAPGGAGGEADVNGKLARLEGGLAAMAEMVERNVDTAVMALIDRNPRFAYEVISFDIDVDEMEIETDRLCLDLLQNGRMDQSHFRFVAAAIKINNDLERISDQAVTISQHVLNMLKYDSTDADGGQLFAELLDRIEVMVRQSVEALIDRDGRLAWQIIEEDALVDARCREIIASLTAMTEARPHLASVMADFLQAALALERIGDQATNIAEEVIYMAEGKVVKHHLRESHKGRLSPTRKG